MVLSQVKNEVIYHAIQILSTQKGYPVYILCEIAGINKSSYYKWLNRNKSKNEIRNDELLQLIREAYEEKDGILGYRQMTIKLRCEHNLTVNYKRIYRLMKIVGLESVCRKKKYNYIKSTPEKILNREIKAEHTEEK